MERMSNEEMVKAYQDGDREMLTRLLEANEFALQKIVGRYRLQNSDWHDAMQEARLCLMKAAQKFDCSRGLKFSTYFFTAVTHWTRRWHQSSRLVHIPHHRFGFTHGRGSIKSLPTCILLTFDNSSWSRLVDNGRPEDRLVVVEEQAEEERVFHIRWRRLSKKEQAVIRGRLDGKTLMSIGKEFGVSKERIRQIEAAAIEKLTRSNRARA
jgi:RNA polymerase primary sigma factor